MFYAFRNTGLRASLRSSLTQVKKGSETALGSAADHAGSIQSVMASPKPAENEIFSTRNCRFDGGGHHCGYVAAS